MENDTLQKGWKQILQEQERIQEDGRMPLLGLDEYLKSRDLAGLPEKERSMDAVPLTEIGAPAFKTLTEEIVLSLRGNLYRQRDLDTVGVWAEKLMRFCEIRYRTLKKRAVEKCGNLPAARFHLLHLTVFLLDYFLYTKDLRFFNIALKLLDLSWLVDEKQMSRPLPRDVDEMIGVVFQFRLLLLSESILKRWRQGEML